MIGVSGTLKTLDVGSGETGQTRRGGTAAVRFV